MATTIATAATAVLGIGRSLPPSLSLCVCAFEHTLNTIFRIWEIRKVDSLNTLLDDGEEKPNPSAKWVYWVESESHRATKRQQHPTTSKYVIEFIRQYYVYIRLWMGELLFVSLSWIRLASWHFVRASVCPCVFRATFVMETFFFSPRPKTQSDKIWFYFE